MLNRTLVAIAALATVAAFVLAWGGHGSVKAAVSTVQVGQLNGGSAPSNQFNPAETEVSQGDEVDWQWYSGAHTVVAFAESSPGVPEFQSDVLLSSGQSFQHVFQQPGAFTYYCSIHAVKANADPSVIDQTIAQGLMVGRVTVRAPAPTATPSPTPAPGAEETTATPSPVASPAESGAGQLPNGGAAPPGDAGEGGGPLLTALGASVAALGLGSLLLAARRHRRS